SFDMCGAESPLAGTAHHNSGAADFRKVRSSREAGFPSFERCTLPEAPCCSRDAQYDCGNAPGLCLQSPSIGNLQSRPTAHTLLRVLLYGHQSHHVLNTGRIQPALPATVWFDDDHINVAVNGCRRRRDCADMAGTASDGVRGGRSSGTQELAVSLSL